MSYQPFLHINRQFTETIITRRWQQHPQARLDHPVADFRSVLDSWINSRRQAQHVSHYTEASEYIDWPALKPPPQDDLDDFVPDSTGYHCDMSVADPAHSNVDGSEDNFGLMWSINRRDQREQGLEFLDWQRPPQNQIPQGCYVLASGAVIPEESSQIG